MQAAEPKGSRACSIACGCAGAMAFACSFPMSDTATAGWPLAFVWPALLALSACLAPSWRVLALAVGVPMYLAILAHEWWMRAVTELGMPVLVAYLAGWMVLLAATVRALAGTRRALRWPFAVALPVAVVSNEFLRGDLVCSGYAWFFVAHPLVEWPAFAQVASLGGGWIVSGLAAFLAGAALDAWFRRGRAQIAWPAAALVVLGAVLWFGADRLARLDSAGASDSAPRLLVVQTNLPMSNKLAWSPEAQERDFLAFSRLTLEAAEADRNAGRRIDAAIWPETMLPGFGLEPESIRALVEGRWYPGNRYDEALRELSRRIGAPMVVGSPAFLRLRAEGERFRWDRQFNSAYLVDASGPKGRTDKIFLTPFGEMMPIISNWDWLEAQLLAIGAAGMTFDLDAAERSQPLSLATPAPGVALGVPICFEITAPWASRRIAFESGARRAGVLVNISNDGWFSDSLAGRRQHLQVAQLRAVELDTPVVRCANTGMSASIDAGGRLRERLDCLEEGAFVAHPTPSVGVPLAARLGDGFAWCALVAALVGCAESWHRARRAASSGR